MKSRKTRNRFIELGYAEDGATAVEFALVLPILVMILVATFEFGLAYNNYLAITHAAREGARMAAVGAYDESAVRADAYPVNPTSVALAYPEGNEHGKPAQVTVQSDFDLSIPFWGERHIPLQSRAVMRIEK